MTTNTLFPCLLTTFSIIAVRVSHAHSSISLPEPISYMTKCLVHGAGKSCGPCPNDHFRPSQNETNPKVTVSRNSILTVRTRKNNHIGGFASWSIVKVSDMFKPHKHTAGRFLYECHDINLRYCRNPETRQRDCGSDMEDKYFLHDIRIPKIYPDGVYVLGWVWYGGLNGPGVVGNFGDYYDCVYLRINGGPIEYKHTPTFRPGRSLSGNGTHCKATVNQIGICYKEPCASRNIVGRLMVPREFGGGNVPQKISRGEYF